jgi:hypothetical protein
MTWDKLFTPKLIRYVRKGGAAAIFIVVIALFLNYFQVMYLDKIPIPGLTIGLWIYLIINAGIATPFHYMREKFQDAPLCPKCKKPLKISPKYSCDNCGELEFGDEK